MHPVLENRVRLLKKAHLLTSLRTKEPLESVAIEIFGPVLGRKFGYVFILVILDRFKKLTQALTLRHITAYDVAPAFAEHWTFK